MEPTNEIKIFETDKFYDIADYLSATEFSTLLQVSRSVSAIVDTFWAEKRYDTKANRTILSHWLTDTDSSKKAMLAMTMKALEMSLDQEPYITSAIKETLLGSKMPVIKIQTEQVYERLVGGRASVFTVLELRSWYLWSMTTIGRQVQNKVSDLQAQLTSEILDYQKGAKNLVFTHATEEEESKLLRELEEIPESPQNRLILSQRIVCLMGDLDKNFSHTHFNFTLEVLTDLTILAHSKVYTVPELYSMITFYSSPIGSQIAAKLLIG